MEKITSRAVIGAFKQAMAAQSAPMWVEKIANRFTSDQASEEYPWLSAVPALREWIGGRHAKDFVESSIEIKNKNFEATLEILVKDLRRDKIDVLRPRINDLVKRAYSHPAKLLSTLILNGATGAAYDDKYFFDTDHKEGDSGAQSNKLSIDISGLAVTTGGIITDPAVAEMQICIAKGIMTMVGFLDSAGEPMSEDATSFLVMVPVSLGFAAMQAVSTLGQVAETQTALSELKRKFSIEVEINPRLTWTDRFAIFRTDSFIKPLIVQKETAINIGAKAEGSEFEFDNNAHQYGVSYSGNVEYGLWQYALQVIMI